MRYLLTFFYLLLVCRLFLLDFVLEPTNDEGLWQWNARCEQWSLPSQGILHNALSPVNHWINRALFAIVPPSVVAKRVLCSLLVAVAAGLSCLRLVRRGNESGAVLLLAWLWLDPYLFRMGSWAILEPLLMFGVVVWYQNSDRVAGGMKGSLLLGLLTGLLVGVKLTVIWLVLGTCACLATARRFRELAVFITAAGTVAAVCYASVYFQADHARFAEIWRQHTTARTDVVSNVCGLFQGLPDLRAAFYTLTALLGCGWCVWQLVCVRKSLGAAPWAVMAGLAALATQSCRPERYLFPMAFLALLAALDAGLFRGCRVWLGVGCLLLAMGANGLWYRNFVLAPANAGGWYIHERLEAAVARGGLIAAPPHLALDLRCPVQPVSVGLLALPPNEDYTPDFLALQTAAAEPSGGDLRMKDEMLRRQATVVAKGFYSLYQTLQTSPVPSARP